MYIYVVMTIFPFPFYVVLYVRHYHLHFTSYFLHFCIIFVMCVYIHYSLHCTFWRGYLYFTI